MYAEDDLFVKSPKTGLFLFLLDDTSVQDSIQNGSNIPSQIIFQCTMSALFKSMQGRGMECAHIGLCCPHGHLERISSQSVNSKWTRIKRDLERLRWD